MPTFRASLASTFEVVQTTATCAVRVLVFVAPGVAFDIVVHVLGKPFTAFDLDDSINLTIARVRKRSGLVANFSAVFLFGNAEFRELFALVLLTSFKFVHPSFLSLRIGKLYTQVMDVEQVVTASKVHTGNVDDKVFATKMARLIEIRNPRFHGIAAILVEVRIFDQLCRNSHVTSNRKVKLVIQNAEGNRLDILIMGVFAKTDISINLGRGIFALTFSVKNGIPCLRRCCKHLSDRQSEHGVNSQSEQFNSLHFSILFISWCNVSYFSSTWK